MQPFLNASRLDVRKAQRYVPSPRALKAANKSLLRRVYDPSPNVVPLGLLTPVIPHADESDESTFFQ